MGRSPALILLDTYTWLWMIGNPSQLGEAAKRRVEKQALKGGLGISDISLLEIAMLSKKARIEISGSFLSWLESAVTRSRIVIHPMTPEIVFESTLFPDRLADPADRVIAATAKSLGVPLVTEDREIRTLTGIEMIW
ncbi:MAG TPA: type II toxin-antitoxin system VapC family toxin [Bdellovibrionota bacterium]|nr:type II toxin-antitoxin system VapC family toxin [Bdellovibrionota bacterium]